MRVNSISETVTVNDVQIPTDFLPDVSWRWLWNRERPFVNEFLLYLHDTCVNPEDAGSDELADFAEALEWDGKTPDYIKKGMLAARQLLFHVLETKVYTSRFLKTNPCGKYEKYNVCNKQSTRKMMRDGGEDLSFVQLEEAGIPQHLNDYALDQKNANTRLFVRFLLDLNKKLNTMNFHRTDDCLDDYEAFLIASNMSPSAIRNYLSAARNLVLRAQFPENSPKIRSVPKREPFLLPELQDFDPYSVKFGVYDFFKYLENEGLSFGDIPNGSVAQYREKLKSEARLSLDTINDRIAHIRKVMSEQFGVSVPAIQPQTRNCFQTAWRGLN